jgi:hypothetical protein
MCNPKSVSSSPALSWWASHAACQALCLALLLAWPGGAQNAPPQPHGGLGQQIGQHTDDPLSQLDDQEQYPVEEERRLKALNALRQKSLVEDTNKLLKLAAELNAEVSGEHPDTLTAEQLRKLAEIEKLAHGVKEKMSTSVRQPQGFPPPFTPNLH